MTFKPSIPQPGDLISQSQVDILNNFTSIGTAFDVNHVDFNQSGAGKHFKVEMPNQSPGPTGVAGQATIYANGGDIWAIKGAGTAYQLTDGASGNVDSTSTNGSSFLPGGMIIKWGTSTIIGGTNNIGVTYTTSMPAATFTANGTLNTNAAGALYTIGINGKSLTGFTINVNPTPPGNLTIFWVAIGN